MVAVLTAALVTAAEISSLFSALGVIICLICMVIFILRVNGDEFFGTAIVHVPQPPAVQVSYQKVAVPFSLELLNPSETSYSDVQLKIRSDVSYVFRSYWGVMSDHLHALMGRPWSSFCLDLIDNSELQAEICDKPERCCASNGTFTSKTLNPNISASSLNLGQSPRKKYPLVVCMVRQEAACEEMDPSVVGALITIIHIKDTECQVPSCILHQYLKQYSGQLTKLQALFTQGNSNSDGSKKSDSAKRNANCDRCQESDSTKGNASIDSGQKSDSAKGNANNYSSQNSDNANGEDQGDCHNYVGNNDDIDEDIPIEEACVVCQTNRITRALLPCRHVCVCSSCFSRLDTCPMCRSKFLAYFLVAPENEEPTHIFEHPQEEAPRSTWQRLQDAFQDLMLFEN